VLEYLPHITLAFLAEVLLLAVFIPWVLLTKKDSTAALAWCLVVLAMPVFGSFLFWVFGYNHTYRPLRRKQRHRHSYPILHPPQLAEAARGEAAKLPAEPTWNDFGELALKVDAFPVSPGNAVTPYSDTTEAFAALLAAIEAAKHHVHLEFFIFRPDATGRKLLDLLARKAGEGVEVRLLYDSMGTRQLSWRLLRPLQQAGGEFSSFLPLNPLRSRMQVNLRNHRKIAVIDGRVGFTGGMNIGDEYLGKDGWFGYWRDEFLRLEGPAVAALQRVFVEDWHFACGRSLNAPAYFPEPPPAGEDVVQLIESGPDQETNSIREMYYAAIVSARQRVWIASPYFVPDAGLQDALRLARYRGVEVCLLSLLRGDHFLSFHASRYYWGDMLAAGVKIYQYARGMMHSKVVLVDGRWGMAGSANFDNRSLHLNFEIGCILHSPRRLADLEGQFRRDLEDAVPLDAGAFARRPFLVRLAENGCRLLSPIL
jgi:cardiolipin synthase